VPVRRTSLRIAAVFLLFLARAAGAQTTDSLATYWIEPIEVVGQRIFVGQQRIPIEKDNLSGVLNRNGFKLIRKGVFFAQDVYADGLKRGDINVVIDGERYQSACPNRMDSPLTRVSPFSLRSIELVKTSASVQSGLGGVVHFERRKPDAPFTMTAGIAGSGAAKRSSDALVAAEGRNHRVSMRYAEGDPYTDADDRTFADLYDYRDDFPYRLAEGDFIGGSGSATYGASFAYTQDVSFPYLLMDERTNEVYNASAGWGKHKAYVNYTDHVMDNAMRTGATRMETRATNVTVGAVGGWYDVYFRNWDADNEFRLPADTLRNKMIPDTRTFSGALFQSIAAGPFRFAGKIGGVSHRMGNEARLSFYRPLYPDATSDRFFVTYGASVTYARAFRSGWGAAWMLESASESPQTEALYIAVQKPMNKPWWSGNPTLGQPFRATLRGSVRYRPIRLELYGTYIWDYAHLTANVANATQYMTYGNIDAGLVGFNLNASWAYLDVLVTYTWGENRSAGTRLAEIAPFSLSARVKSPRYHSLDGFVEATYNDAQNRIDESLAERATPSWYRVDIGGSCAYRGLVLTLDVDNVTNELYYQHLSYLRNPFTSGVPVWEPGTAVTLGLRLAI
jgi:iron complex outermembrane receptor protein